jgi:hypothetical protein
MQQKYSVTEIELLAIVDTLKELRGMLWGQSIKVFTDHKILSRDALGLTSDRVYQWRLLLEEYAPKIIYSKGIHNTIADAILQLDYNPSSILSMVTPMHHLVWSLRSQAHNNGSCLHTTGKATTIATHQ